MTQIGTTTGTSGVHILTTVTSLSLSTASGTDSTHDGDPYDYSDYYPYDYDDQSAYVGSGQYGSSATVSAVQSQLAKLGYYRGAVDGVEGDETEAALARYQQDHDLSVTGTLTAATLQSLGLARTAG